MKQAAINNKVTSLVVGLWLLTCLGVAAPAAAHKYFFAISDIHHNQQHKSLEIVHQLTAHDLENTIAEQFNTHFSPEHPDYEKLIKRYVEAHFNITQDNKKLSITWIGIENVRDKIVIYQEASLANFLSRLVVKNDLLVDTYAKQVNTVNFDSGERQLSLTFNNSQRIGIIANNN